MRRDDTEPCQELHDRFAADRPVALVVTTTQ